MLAIAKDQVRALAAANATSGCRQHQVHLPRQLQAEVLAHHLDGARQGELARAYGIHRTTVRSIIDRWIEAD